MVISICLSFYFRMGLSPHLMGEEDSHLLYGPDFGAITFSVIGALLTPLTAQETLALLKCM